MIGDLRGLPPQEMAIKAEAKAIAAEILFNFLKSDIEGTVEQLNNNNPLPVQKEGYIVR